MTWDCFSGQHHWCTGSAWDQDRRDWTPCTCRCHARRTPVTRVAHPFDTGRVRYGKDECEHGMPGGTPATCALCRIAQPDQLELEVDDVVDVRMLAAGER